MSKFCQNCGTQMDDQATVCANCGTAEAPAAPAQKDIVGAAKAQLEKATSDPKALIPVLGILAALIVVVILLVTLLGGGGYKKAVDNYFDVTYKFKANKIEKLAPKEYWNYLEEEMDYDMDEMIEEAEESAEDQIDEMEDTYGKNYKVKYEIKDKDKLSKKKLEDLAEALNDQYDIKESSVKKAYKIDIEGEIKGSEDDEDIEMEDVIVVKIGGSWYLVNTYEMGEETYVSFGI